MSVRLDNLSEKHRFRIKDPVSAGTHFTGFILALAAAPVLLVHSAGKGMGTSEIISQVVFMLSMMILYAASTVYHTFSGPLSLKKFDHMSIFLLIAGTYTPCCVSIIGGADGRQLMILVWLIAAAGIVFKFFWVTCPRWVSSVIYIMMGWAVIWKMPALLSGISQKAFTLLLAGGLCYTVGGVIYALKLRLIPENRIGFGNHELFHVLVMAGSLCHWVMLYTL